MAVTAKKNSGEMIIAPAGVHVACCIRIIDLGIQEREYKGQKKKQHRVKIGWELPNEKFKFNENEPEKPFIIHAEYTLSTSEKGNLRPMLESWMNRKLTAEEQKEIDLSKFLNKACQVSIIHDVKPNATYANVASVTPLMKGITCPPATNEAFIFEIGASRMMEIYEKLPKRMQETIAKSDEWKTINQIPISEEDKTFFQPPAPNEDDF